MNNKIANEELDDNVKAALLLYAHGFTSVNELITGFMLIHVAIAQTDIIGHMRKLTGKIEEAVLELYQPQVTLMTVEYALEVYVEAIAALPDIELAIKEDMLK